MPGDERSLLQSFRYRRMSKLEISTLSEKRLVQTFRFPPTCSHAPAVPTSIAKCSSVLQCGLPCTRKCLQLVIAPVKGWFLATKGHTHFILLVCSNANLKTKFAWAKSPDSCNFFSKFWVLGTFSSNVKINPVISWNGHTLFQRIFLSNSGNFTTSTSCAFHLIFLFRKEPFNCLWEMLVD